MENKGIIATKLSKGSGLGNQLFYYVTTRALALEQGFDFAVFGSEFMANNIHSDCGLYFMDLDYGRTDVPEGKFTLYKEREDRLYIPNSWHDITHGCYVAGADEKLFHLENGMLLQGNLQDESYYIKYIKEIKQWLKVKEEYECNDFADDDICVLHVRCGDYLGNRELLLRNDYWLHGIREFRKINSAMKFVAVTNGVEEAKKMLPPEVDVYNFDISKDYSILKNAKYLLLGNSSFAYFPALTNENVKRIIAPKYWARYNVSDGYWASEQNIYSNFEYMDRKGQIFSADECWDELQRYKERKNFKSRINKKPGKLDKARYHIKDYWYRGAYKVKRLLKG